MSASSAALPSSASAVPPPRKRTKQTSASTAAIIPDDTAFQPHTTRRDFYCTDSVSECACFLNRDARILVLGDGDLSYSVGLVKHLMSERHQQDSGRMEFDNFMSEAEVKQMRVQQQQQTTSASTSNPAPPSSSTFSVSSLQLTCTTYESISTLSTRYIESTSNATLLRSWGIKVLHGVDARRVHEYTNLMSWETERRVHGSVKDREETEGRLRTEGETAVDQNSSSSSASQLPADSPRFHQILFHFPHVGGKSRIHLNRALLTEFLQSAQKCIVRPGDAILPALASASAITDDTPMLDSSSSSSSPHVELHSGCIQVSLIRGQGGTPCDTRHRPQYGDHWQLLECATKADLLMSHAFPFCDALYEGYNNRGFRSRDEEFFWRGVAITHVLTKARKADGVPRLIPAAEPSSSSSTSSSSLITSTLPSDLQYKMTRDLCRVPHHPLQQISAFLTAQFLASTSDREVYQEQIMKRSELEKYQQANSSSGAVTEYLSLDEHTVLRPNLLVHLPHLLSQTSGNATSFTLSGAVYPPSSRDNINSLQWNTKAIVSATADMEKQIPKPRCVEMEEMAVAGTVYSKSVVTTASTFSSPSSSHTADLVVPLMQDGMSILHHQLMCQFVAAPSSTSSATEVAAAINTDMQEAATSYLRALFGGDIETRVVRLSSSAAATLQIAGTATIDLALEIQLRWNKVWHAVGRGGLLPRSSASFSSSSSSVAFSTTAATGWLIEWSLDKLAMLRFDIHDPRWFWSEDVRFLAQFTKHNSDVAMEASSLSRSWHQFIPFSLHPLCYVRDNSFWLHPTVYQTAASASTAEQKEFEHNEEEGNEQQQPMKKQKCAHHDASSAAAAVTPSSLVTTTSETASSSSHSSSLTSSPRLTPSELTRIYIHLMSSIIGRDICISIVNTDNFTHPQRGPAMRFRCLYSSLDGVLSPPTVIEMQKRLHERFVELTGVEMR